MQPGPLIKRGDGFAADADILDPSSDRVIATLRAFRPLRRLHAAALGRRAVCRLESRPRRRRDRTANDSPSPAPRPQPGAAWISPFAAWGLRIQIGLHRRRSTDVVDMQACPILHPTLFALVQALRPVLLRLEGLKSRGEASVNLVDNGPDLLLRTDADLTARDRTTLATFAQANGVPRISATRIGSIDTEPAAALSRPMLTLHRIRDRRFPPARSCKRPARASAPSSPPSLRMLPEKVKGPIIELYAGSGSLTHAISTRGRVIAYEGDTQPW